MAIYINTNVASLTARNSLSQVNQELKVNQERLSTGLRINSAADDAAGMAITDRMTSQITGLNQATRNANGGISLAQTAEGALDESMNMLQRMRELAVQSSNDSNTSEDRKFMQEEVNQLINEVNRIATSTTYNQQNILNGSFENAVFQVGANTGESNQISYGISNAQANALGATSGVATGNYTLAKETSSANELADLGAGNTLPSLGEGDLALNGVEIGATKSGDDTTSYAQNASSAIALAAAINRHSDETNVHAAAQETETFVNITADGNSGMTFSINGVEITNNASNATTAPIGTAIANAINNESGLAVDASYSGGTVTLTALDGRNITLEATNSQFADNTKDMGSAGDTTTVRGNVSLYSNESFTIGGSAPGNADLTATEVSLSETLLTDVAGTPANTFEDLQKGDITINGYEVEAPSETTWGGTQASDVDPNSSALAISNAINNTEGLSGEVTASAKTVANLGKVSAYDASVTNNDVDLTVNGTSTTIDKNIEGDDANGYLRSALNTEFTNGTLSSSNREEGLKASVNSDGELLITADDGRNIDINVENGSTGNSTPAKEKFLDNLNTTTTSTDVVAKGTVSLEAKEGYTVQSVEGGKQPLAGIETNVGTVENIDISTREGANDAIEALDAAITQIDETQSNLGAIQNRFESTIDNLTNVTENLTEARSRIRDADIAKEASEMTQNNVRRQAASSVLAQANQNPQMALQLLGG